MLTIMAVGMHIYYFCVLLQNFTRHYNLNCEALCTTENCLGYALHQRLSALRYLKNCALRYIELLPCTCLAMHSALLHGQHAKVMFCGRRGRALPVCPYFMNFIAAASHWQQPLLTLNRSQT